MKDSIDVVGSSLPPRSFEAPETEGPMSLLDPAGGSVELSHDLGGSVGALLRDVGGGRDVLLNAPQRPSAAVPRRSQEVLGRLPPGRAANGIVNLPAATRDIDQAHVRVEDLEPFGLSRAGDADVQDGEVEMRDTVPPELMHELRVASFQIPRRVEVAGPDLPFDRDVEQGSRRAGSPERRRRRRRAPASRSGSRRDSGHGASGDRSPANARFRSTGTARAPAAGRRSDAGTRSPRGRPGLVPQAVRTLQVNGCAARSRGGGGHPAARRDRAPTPRAAAAPWGGASGGMPSRFFAYFTTNRLAGSASVMTW